MRKHDQVNYQASSPGVNTPPQFPRKTVDVRTISQGIFDEELVAEEKILTDKRLGHKTNVSDFLIQKQDDLKRRRLTVEVHISQVEYHTNWKTQNHQFLSEDYTRYFEKDTELDPEFRGWKGVLYAVNKALYRPICHAMGWVSFCVPPSHY